MYNIIASNSILIGMNIKKFTLDNNNILDPLSCILRLILLKYKNKGTKLSVNNNKISYNENTYVQGVVRALNHDKREDLHNLYYPIQYACIWYPNTIEENRLLFKGALKGLHVLLDVYESNSIIHHTLIHYIQIINNYLDNKTDESISSNKSQIIDKLQVLWKPEEISIIYELIKHINRLHNKGERDLYINIVDQIILSKEEWVYNYILDISSTYNK